MPQQNEADDKSNRVLVKLRPSLALRAAESRVNLRPLYDEPKRNAAESFGIASAPQWYLADLPDGAATPWDLAHSKISDQLGVDDSDVLFAEPDLIHNIYKDPSEPGVEKAFAAGDECQPIPQDDTHGKAAGPSEYAWHLSNDYSELGKARGNVNFADPRTRIAHIDTGYYRAHQTAPLYILHDLERNFVEGDTNPNSAEDPDNRVFLIDNSGHGTGTIGILAGKANLDGIVLGGAPDAEIIPIRVADRVVLLRTSSLARGFNYAVEQRCDVVTLSMGGVPSQAWGEAVDAAYEAGVCICAAAGNHIGITPPYTLVYPARYSRVLAVCGVMADGRPYAGLKGTAIEGSFGPESAMKAAIATYTPNIPWPVFMCPDAVRLNGEGTSAATPQVAAAVALWFEKYKNELPRDWRRVEAVRNALFTSSKMKSDKEHFGNGVLQANRALSVKPMFGLQKSDESKTSFAFLRILTGLGIGEIPPREHMFNLELAQRCMVNVELQKIVPDPEQTQRLEGPKLRRFMEAVIEDPGASVALRKHIAGRYPVAAGGSAPSNDKTKTIVPEVLAVSEGQPDVQNPPYRRVRVYAVDPSLSTRFDTAGVNEVTLKLRWESLKVSKTSGPIGEYIMVEDIDAKGNNWKPVDLDDPRLLAQDGWAPSEGNPQFHQQMVYAVSMKTIEYFERALGRPVLWRPRPNEQNPNDDRGFIRQLKINPHALRQANAYYSPEKVALLFGYFEAAGDDPGDHMPGSRIFSCLSHDIIAHETTHAILDGMYRRFNEPTNPDVLALHEGFADIVALMQHFTIPEVLEQEISRTRGNIEAESTLGSLAVQFGYATGSRGALRNAIGSLRDGVWTRNKPDPSDLQKRITPHARGAILVAAVFDAFIAIYNSRIADLLRIYTGGTGILPTGSIHPDLVKRLADEATKSASHVLNMCIRALDYLPPVDVTFFEYLRALITADFDLVSDDRYNYRVAFVEAFRRRGIYPANMPEATSETVRTLSADTLRWEGLEQSEFSGRIRARVNEQYSGVIELLKRYADTCLYISDRAKLFEETREQRRRLHNRLIGAFREVPQFAAGLGLSPGRSFEVHELRRASRVSPDGKFLPQVVVALTQSQTIRQKGTPTHIFRGGSTLLVDLSHSQVKYRIVKNINSKLRRERSAAYVREVAADPLRGLYFSQERREPFAALHALADDSGL